MCASPEYTPLDDIDRAILQLLQRDARNLTAVEIAERIGVSDSTVRNRIQNLEAQNIIEGYVPLVNYERAGFQLEVKIVGTARIVKRHELAEQALQIEGVVEVQELMTGRWNIEVVAIAPTHDALTDIAVALDDLGIEVERESLIKHHYFRPSTTSASRTYPGAGVALMKSKYHVSNRYN